MGGRAEEKGPILKGVETSPLLQLSGCQDDFFAAGISPFFPLLQRVVGSANLWSFAREGSGPRSQVCRRQGVRNASWVSSTLQVGMIW